LCDRCSGAQILTKDLVAHLAAGRGHAFRGVGALELKGLPEPVEAVEVYGSRWRWRPARCRCPHASRRCPRVVWSDAQPSSNC
jgi:hypothetical protein